MVHAGNRVFNRSLPGLCALAKYGSNCAGQTRRDPGIFAFYLVVHDVRRRYRRWHADLFNRRANLYFTTNPETIQGLAQSQDAGNVRNAYKWALLHYGLTPWACYGIVGMALGYLSYAKDMPLTIRSGLQPMFGRRLSGWLGHLVDIAAILATLIGLGVTIGYGVRSSQQVCSTLAGFLF